jgi:3-isopropylmalate/(R)-2-methylmalate dehydratase small subunit
VQAYRAAVSEGLPVLAPCDGVLALCETGDELEVDFASGRFVNLTRGLHASFAGLPPALQDVIARGGNAGWLAHWWQTEGRDAASGRPGSPA